MTDSNSALSLWRKNPFTRSHLASLISTWLSFSSWYIKYVEELRAAFDSKIIFFGLHFSLWWRFVHAMELHRSECCTRDDSLLCGILVRFGTVGSGDFRCIGSINEALWLVSTCGRQDFEVHAHLRIHQLWVWFFGHQSAFGSQFAVFT